MMERILEWMRDRGFEKAELAVFATNDRARRLYASMGFSEEGVRRKHVRIRGGVRRRRPHGLVDRARDRLHASVSHP